LLRPIGLNPTVVFPIARGIVVLIGVIRRLRRGPVDQRQDHPSPSTPTVSGIVLAALSLEAAGIGLASPSGPGGCQDAPRVGTSWIARHDAGSEATQMRSGSQADPLRAGDFSASDSGGTPLGVEEGPA
jgi:hypothetical protein